MPRDEISRFDDTVVIYHSDEDGCWIAHSLRADQIGTGDRIVDALADLIKAMDQVCRLAARDPSVAYLRDAPPEVQERARSSSPLPREINEVAYRMARGDGPGTSRPISGRATRQLHSGWS